MTGLTDLPVGGRRILEALYGECEEWFFNFAYLQRETGCTREEVSKACRVLRARGVLEFARGLMTGDGEVAGSGYRMSDAGREAFSEMLAEEVKG